MRKIIAYIRVTLVIAVTIIGTIGVVVTSFLPIKHRGAPLCGWVATWMARMFIRIMPLKFECRDRKKFTQHNGFIFPNHDSYLDVILPMSLYPMRFLAMSEVRDYPLIGKVTQAVGTVFVDRADQNSRQQARESLAQLDTFPPIVLYPEGGIDGDESLQPFRYGAFELAIENQIAYLPAAIIYDPFEVAQWGDATKSIGAMVMQLAMQKRVHARLIALRKVEPRPDDNPKELAMEAHGAISAALVAYGGREYEVVKEGL